MGKTFANLTAERVEKPGYYFNAKLCKLARLDQGDKLPTKVGPWEFVADEHELSSSQVVRKLLDMKPGIDPQSLTYTVHSPLDRLPIGEPTSSHWFRKLVFGVALIGLGVWLGRTYA